MSRFPSFTFLPTHRLLAGTALVFFPAALVPVFVPDARGPALAAMAVFSSLVFLDILVSFRTLSSLRVTVPEVVRLTRGRNGVLPFSLAGDFKEGKTVRLGFILPPGLVSPTDLYFSLPQENSDKTLDWPLTPERQGRHSLRDIRIEIFSRAGFWAFRERRNVTCEIRVYPDLRSERKALASLFLERGTGVHARKMVGKGREFEKLREYTAGDSYEDIHWKATARRGSPISKVFQVERTQDIYVFVDNSRMSARHVSLLEESPAQGERRKDRAGGETVFERYVSAALVLALAAEKQGDRFGIGVFSDAVTGFVKARGGKSHFDACRDMVYPLAPRKVSPDYPEFFTFAGTRLRKRSLVFILTSLEDPAIAESFLRHVHILSSRHLVVAIMMKPASARPLFDRKAGDVTGVRDLCRHLAGHDIFTRLAELDRSLARHAVGLVLADHPSLGQTLVNRYLDIKRRQTL